MSPPSHRHIDGFHLVETLVEKGRAELESVLAEVLCHAEQELTITAVQDLKKTRVVRIDYVKNCDAGSVVAKRLTSHGARGEQSALRHWLPVVGLQAIAIRLLAHVDFDDGASAWHVYEDLGDWSLAGRSTTPDEVSIALAAVARLHRESVDHPVLEECRAKGADRGMSFYETFVRRALCGLESLDELPSHFGAIRARLLEHFHTLDAQGASRAEHMIEFGGPDVLLHGDLWTGNVFVLPGATGFSARLIDWDKSGVGSAVYDLSAFLSRYSPADRPWVLAAYRASRYDWQLPNDRELNRLFETVEHARIANAITWIAEACADPAAQWAFERLDELSTWVAPIEPMLAG